MMRVEDPNMMKCTATLEELESKLDTLAKASKCRLKSNFFKLKHPKPVRPKSACQAHISIEHKHGPQPVALIPGIQFSRHKNLNNPPQKET